MNEMTTDYTVHPDREGFLDDTSFNGVIFLLREPNAGDGKTQTDFWFKKRLPGNYKYDDSTLTEAQIRNDKRAHTKYLNRFKEMLTYVFPGSDEERCYKELCRSAYFNLRPDAGNRSVSEKYTELLNDPCYVRSRFESIAGYCKKRTADELTVFTCTDIFNKLAEYYSLPEEDKKPDGVDCGKYGKKQFFKWNGPDHFGIPVTVYEIMHPSRSPKLICK